MNNEEKLDGEVDCRFADAQSDQMMHRLVLEPDNGLKKGYWKLPNRENSADGIALMSNMLRFEMHLELQRASLAS